MPPRRREDSPGSQDKKGHSCMGPLVQKNGSTCIYRSGPEDLCRVVPGSCMPAWQRHRQSNPRVTRLAHTYRSGSYYRTACTRKPRTFHPHRNGRIADSINPLLHPQKGSITPSPSHSLKRHLITRVVQNHAFRSIDRFLLRSSHGNKTADHTVRRSSTDPPMGRHQTRRLSLRQLCHGNRPQCQRFQRRLPSRVHVHLPLPISLNSSSSSIDSRAGPSQTTTTPSAGTSWTQSAVSVSRS